MMIGKGGRGLIEEAILGPVFKKKRTKKIGPLGWLAYERALLVFLGGGAFGGLPNDDSIGVVVLIDVVGMEGGFHYRGKRPD